MNVTLTYNLIMPFDPQFTLFNWHRHTINDNSSVLILKMFKYFKIIVKKRSKLLSCNHCKNIEWRKEWLDKELNYLNELQKKQDNRFNTVQSIIKDYSYLINKEQREIETCDLCLSFLYLYEDKLCWKCKKRLHKLSRIHSIFLWLESLLISNQTTNKK